MILDRIHDWSLRTQVVVMLGCVAFISATLTSTLVNLGVRVALEGESDALVHRATSAVGAVVVFVALCTVVASLGAGTLLRLSIGRTVRELEQATATIASGGFDHRLGSTRGDELGQLARAIDAMAARLAELETARQQLLATVSHELRTPLTVIRGHAFTLGRHEMDPGRRARLELIDGEVERLARLIDDLLSASTTREVSVALDDMPVDAAELVRVAAGRFREVAAGVGVEIDVVIDTPARVRVDAARIHQVIGNLLANAIAHAPAGTRVQLRLSRPRGRSREVRVSVTNGGSGIPREQLGSIFEPFTQGPMPTGSVGLGLSIARDLVRAHGCDLTVRSRPGQTMFAFDLPVASARRGATPLVSTAAGYAT